jgi:hypothetical protein
MISGFCHIWVKTAVLWTVMQRVVVMSVRNYHYTLHYGPGEHRSQNFFSVPSFNDIGVWDRISGFGNIEECSCCGVLMNITVSIFTQ